jgi:tellurite resistance protein TehA-like permease
MTLSDLLWFFITGWGLPFTVYVLAQIFVPFRLRGAWRGLSLLPVPVMAYVVYATVGAFNEHSNMWPILLIIASPVAAFFLVLLFFLTRNWRDAV